MVQDHSYSTREATQVEESVQACTASVIPLMTKEVNVQESNILAYIGGYIAKKCKARFVTCKGCRAITTSMNLEAEHLDFMQEKQYEHLELTDKGLTVPSNILVDAVIELETIFRNNFPFIVHHEKVRGRLFTKAMENQKFQLLKCEIEGCNKLKSFVGNLFFGLRIHHALKLQNRSFSKPNQKRNRKALKLLHL